MAEMHETNDGYEFRRSQTARGGRERLTVVLTAPKRSNAEPRQLHTLVKQLVVPRLYEALTKGLPTAKPQPILSTGSTVGNEVTALGDRLLADDGVGASARVDALRNQGRSLECIFLNLFAPTASYLRHLWASDYCGFAETTLALLGLQTILRDLAPAFRAEQSEQETGLRALIAASHRDRLDVGTTMFGLVMMSEFFRRGGWDAWIEPSVSSPELAGVVKDQWFDIVAVPVQNDERLEAVVDGIKTIRRNCPNRSVGVVVCGQLFVDHPEFVRLVGADMSSSDPRSIVTQAQHFVSLATPHARLL